MAVDLSIIIVNYNGRRFLKECLDSIGQFADVTHEIIIVDNASLDGSVEFLKRDFPGVKVIAGKENIGFGRANNTGAQLATGRFILLLNNDTKLLSPISPVILYMKRHADVGIVGCRLVNSDGTIQFSVGYYHTPLRLLSGWMLPKYLKRPLWCQLYEKREPFYNKTHDSVQWVSGAFMLVRREVWDLLNGMDMNFFMYMEDVDFCQRAADAGWKTAYFPEVSIMHYEGGSGAWRSLNAFLYTVDSYRVYLIKHYGKSGWLVVKIFLSPVMLFRALLHAISFLLCCDKEGMIKGGIYLAAVKRLFKKRSE